MKKFKFSSMKYPSIKQHSNKHLAFIDPSKAEEDKLSEEYLKEMIELNRILTLKSKPYNQTDIQRSDLLTTSMKDEVALKQTIADLASHQSDPVSARFLKEEQEQSEKRARRHYILFQDNLLNAQEKENFYRVRPYLSHGTCIKMLIILQCNVVQKLRYASENMHANGVLLLALYTLFYIFVGVPVQFAMRALSQYSKCSIITMWNFCPFFKGTGVMMLIYSVYFMLRSVAFVSILLYMFVDVLSGWFGWMVCDEDAEVCYSEKSNETEGTECLNTSISRIPPVYSSGISYYKTLVKSSFSAFDVSLKWDGILSLLSVWMIVLFFTIAGFEKFIKIAGALFIPIVVCGGIVLSVMLSSGSSSAVGLTEFFTIRTENLSYIASNMFVGEIFFDCLVANGLINFVSAHVPHYVDPMVDTYIFAMTDLTITACLTLSTFAAAGFLQTHYNTKHTSCFLIHRDITLMAVMPEFLSRIDWGKLWIFLYLLFVIMSQVIFIATVAHMTVDSITDTFNKSGSSSSSSSHSSLLFLLVGCGFTYNIFFDFASYSSLVDNALEFTMELMELVSTLNFIIAVVFMYSSTTLCNNVYLITNHKPSSFCEFSLKLSFLIIIICVVNKILSVSHNEFINWVQASQLIIVAFLPIIVFAVHRISHIFHKHGESLFGTHENWMVNRLVRDGDPTRPRYEKNLICTHRCLRQYVFNHFEEARLASLRKCFAIAYAPYLFDIDQ